jgi:integrase-like protein
MRVMISQELNAGRTPVERELPAGLFVWGIATQRAHQRPDRCGKLLGNGYIESFNGKLRDECLNKEIFCSLREAQVIVEM